MNYPLVSVIIPTFNRETTIKRAIDSVISQSYSNIEVIVVDDNSNDRTAEIMEQYSNSSHINYIRLKKNIGGAAARNVGIKHSKGSYIAFQDSDDEWLESKLEKQMNVFQKKKSVDVVFSKIIRISEEKRSIFPKSDISEVEDAHTSFLKENYIGTPSAIIKKEKLDQIEGFDESLPRLQDWDLFIQLSKFCTFFMVDEVLCNAYLQSNSITQNKKALIETLKIFDKKYKDSVEALSREDKAGVYEKYGSLLVNSGSINEGVFYFKKGISSYPYNFKLFFKLLLIKIGGEKMYRKFKK